MGLNPIPKRKSPFTLKTCSRCGQSYGADQFAPTKSLFYPDGVMPICNDCVQSILAQASDDEWTQADKFCQLIDIPFVPSEWEKIKEMAPGRNFYQYAQAFQNSEYEGLGWKEYFDAFKDLKDKGRLEEELPLLAEEKRQTLKKRWGANYDDEALYYLEDLYNGLITTQNINGALQKDQAYKICKMSYEIDCRIREGSEFDKLLGSYDKLVKAAEFTPKNVKNINDFDTCGELIKWLEKTGWQNKYYDNVPRDVVDETIANIQSFNQRLYTNESGIGEEITNRLEALRHTEQIEKGNYYDTGSQIKELDKYDDAGYDKLFNQDEEFQISLDDEED